MNEMEKSFVERLKKGLDFADSEKTEARARKAAAEEILKMAERAVNNFGFHRNEVAEEINRDDLARTLMLHIAYEWIRFYGSLDKDHYLIDGRNEMTAYLCRELAGTQDFHTLEELYFQENTPCCAFAKEFVELASVRMHRTNQQTFAGLLFKLVDLQQASGYGEVLKEIREDRGEEWYRMAMV